jgi:hypothetical protein
MPKRTDIQSILIIGAAVLALGQGTLHAQAPSPPDYAEILDGIKKCNINIESTTFDVSKKYYSTQVTIISDEREFKISTIPCLAAELAGNTSRIEFQESDLNKEFKDLVKQSNKLISQRDFDLAYAAALECGVAKENMAKVDHISDNMLSVGSELKPVEDKVWRCLVKKLGSSNSLWVTNQTDDNRLQAAKSFHEKEINTEKAKRAVKSFKLRGRFVKYDPIKGSLAAYGGNVEKLCGAKPGKYLDAAWMPNFLAWRTDPEKKDLTPRPIGDLGCVWTLLTLSDLEKHGANFGGSIRIKEVLNNSPRLIVKIREN